MKSDGVALYNEGVDTNFEGLSGKSRVDLSGSVNAYSQQTKEKNMLKGRTLTQMAQELERIQASKEDFILATKEIEAKVKNKKIALNFDVQGESKTLPMNTYSSGQMSSYLDIPLKYYRTLEEQNPELLADNINHGLGKKGELVKRGDKPEGRLIRSLDDSVRGFLSSSYRRLDSYDLLETVLPIIQNQGMEIVSSEITDKRLYIKALSPKLKKEVLNKDDIVQYGLVISNSDVGAGSVRIEPMLYRLVCLNGMISNTAMRRFHTGRNQIEDQVYQMLSEETLSLDDQAFWSKVTDLLKASMEEVNFSREVERVREAAASEITNFKLEQVVEETMKAVKLTGEKKKEGILAALATGNEGVGLNKWGLINSFTKAAHKIDGISYEDSIEMERAGGKILDLSKSQWRSIAEAPAA